MLDIAPQISSGFYGVDIKETDHGFIQLELGQGDRIPFTSMVAAFRQGLKEEG